MHVGLACVVVGKIRCQELPKYCSAFGAAAKDSRQYPHAGRLGRSQPQKIPVVRYQHSLLPGRKGQLIFIRCPSEPCFLGSRHIHAALAQTGGNGRIDVFIQVEAYWFRHHAG